MSGANTESSRARVTGPVRTLTGEAQPSGANFRAVGRPLAQIVQAQHLGLSLVCFILLFFQTWTNFKSAPISQNAIAPISQNAVISKITFLIN